METMKLRAIQHPGHAGELLDSFIRAEGNLPRDSPRAHARPRTHADAREGRAALGRRRRRMARLDRRSRDLAVVQRGFTRAVARTRTCRSWRSGATTKPDKSKTAGTWVRVRADELATVQRMNMRILIVRDFLGVPSPPAVAVVAARPRRIPRRPCRPAVVRQLRRSCNPPSTSAADLALADRIYKGNERTPAGFDVESRPASVDRHVVDAPSQEHRLRDRPAGHQPHLRGLHERHGAGHRLV